MADKQKIEALAFGFNTVIQANCPLTMEDTIAALGAVAASYLRSIPDEKLRTVTTQSYIQALKKALRSPLIIDKTASVN